MRDDRPLLGKSDVASSLWRKYEKTDEYIKLRHVHAMSSVHPLIRSAEQYGLAKVIRNFIAKLEHMPAPREYYENRTKQEWVKEWCSMHNELFKTVLKSRGSFRKRGIDVRFGTPGDEDRHRIPKGGIETLTETYEMAAMISQLLKLVDHRKIVDVSNYLAKVHYEFIRVHPFPDGNGRIARAVTDQLAISLGYPPIIAGFPRLNEEKKEKYHNAINGCADDLDCRTLSEWIKLQIIAKIEDIS